MKYYFPYLHNSFLYTPRSPYFLMILGILEFLPIWCLTLSSTSNINNIFQNNTKTFSETFHINLTLITVFRNNLSIGSSTEKTSWITFSGIFLIIFLLLLIVITYYIILYITNNTIDKKWSVVKRKFQGFTHSIIISFYDCFFFRWASTYILFFLLNFVINNANTSSVYSITSLILVLIYIKIAILHISLRKFIMIFHSEQDQQYRYPYNSFSSRIDVFYLIWKVFLAAHASIIDNTSDNIENNYKYLSLFISCFSLVLIVAYVILSVNMLFTTLNLDLCITNVEFNVLRLFFLFYLFIISFTDICINISGNKYIYVFSHVTTVILSGFIVKMILAFQNRKWLSNSSWLNCIVKWIDIYNIINKGNDLSLNQEHCISEEEDLINNEDNKHNQNQIQFIREICLNHLLICTVHPKCEVCEYITKYLNNYSKLRKTLLRFIEWLYSYQMKYYSLFSESVLRSIIDTFIEMEKHKSNYFMLSLLYTKIKKQLMATNTNLAGSLCWYYYTILNQSFNDANKLTVYDQAALIITNEEMSNLLTEVMETIEWISKQINLSPDDWWSSSHTWYTLKKKLKDKIMPVNHTNTYSSTINDYQIIIIRYIIDNILNNESGLNNNFNILNYDTMLEEHFNSDSFFILKYSIINNSVTIYRTSKDYILYENRKFESWFPFQEVISKKWVEHLGKTKHSEMKILEFPIKTLKGNDGGSVNDLWNSNLRNVFVSSFAMRFFPFPGLNEKELYIHLDYKKDYKNVIMTKANNLTKEENIVHYSQSLIYFILLPIELWNEFTNNSWWIPFNKLWSNKNNNQSDYIYNKKNEYIVYINEMLAKYIEKTNKLRTQEESDILAEIKSKTKPTDIELHVLKRDSFPLEQGSVLNIYYLKKNISPSKTTDNQRTETQNLNDSNEIFDDYHKYGGVNNTNSIDSYAQITSSQNTHTESQTGSSLHSSQFRSNPEWYHQIQLEKQNKARQYKQFSMFTILILISNITLILITIIFLFLEIYQSNEFKTRFLWFQNYNKFYRLFTGQAINWFFNICIAKQNTTECDNNFTQYSDAIIDEFGLDPTFNISKWINDELEVKLGFYDRMLTGIKDRIYETNDPEWLENADGEMLYTFWNVEFSEGKEKYVVNNHKYSFFYLWNAFSNWINMIVIEKRHVVVPVHIIKIGGSNSEDIDISEIVWYEDPLKRKVQKGYYQFIMNYNNMAMRLRKFRIRISQMNKSSINTLKLIAIVFSVLLMGLHFLLLWLCLLWFRIYISIIKSSYRDVLKKINDKRNIGILFDKIHILRDWMKMYFQPPWIWINNYNQIKEKAIRNQSLINKQVLTETENNLIISVNKKVESISDQKYSELLFKARLVVYPVFSLYYMFSFVYLIMFIVIIDLYVSLWNSFETSSQIDATILFGYAIMQLMILTNQSSVDMLRFIEDANLSEDETYLSYLTGATHLYLETTEKAERKLKSSITPLMQKVNLTCEGVGNLIMEDQITLKTVSFNPSTDTLMSLTKWCQGYDWFQNQNDKMFIKYVLFLMSQISNRFSHTYTDLMELNVSKLMYKCTVVILLYYRPIRAYETGTLYLEYINNVDKEYNIYIYSYLFINTLLEITLFLVLKKYVITRFIKSNKGMNWWNKCLYSVHF